MAKGPVEAIEICGRNIRSPRGPFLRWVDRYGCVGLGDPEAIVDLFIAIYGSGLLYGCVSVELGFGNSQNWNGGQVDL